MDARIAEHVAERFITNVLTQGIYELLPKYCGPDVEFLTIKYQAYSSDPAQDFQGETGLRQVVELATQELGGAPAAIGAASEDPDWPGQEECCIECRIRGLGQPSTVYDFTVRVIVKPLFYGYPNCVTYLWLERELSRERRLLPPEPDTAGARMAKEFVECVINGRDEARGRALCGPYSYGHASPLGDFATEANANGAKGLLWLGQMVRELELPQGTVFVPRVRQASTEAKIEVDLFRSPEEAYAPADVPALVASVKIKDGYVYWVTLSRYLWQEDKLPLFERPWDQVLQENKRTPPQQLLKAFLSRVNSGQCSQVRALCDDFVRCSYQIDTVWQDSAGKVLGTQTFPVGSGQRLDDYAQGLESAEAMAHLLRERSNNAWLTFTEEDEEIELDNRIDGCLTPVDAPISKRTIYLEGSGTIDQIGVYDVLFPEGMTEVPENIEWVPVSSMPASSTQPASVPPLAAMGSQTRSATGQFCPSCGTGTEPGWRFCASCGQAVP